MYEDKVLKCRDCGEEFVLQQADRSFMRKRVFRMNLRDANHADAKRTAEKTPRVLTTVCADCGKEAKVPFEPTNDRPVYCSECYAARKQ